MKNNNLPTDDLKFYGIINSDNTFTNKLTANEVLKFLQGETIIADNKKKTITFQLTQNNTHLDVNIFERDKNLQELLEKSQKEIQYTDVKATYEKNKEQTAAQLKWTKSAFVFDEKTNLIREFDFIRNAKILEQTILERQRPEETSKYKNELLKLKEFLLEKLDKYPEIAKEITNDINIVSQTIESVNSISAEEKQIKNSQKENIQLGVNDPDMYQDANLERENEEEQEEMENLEKSKRRGR